MAFASPIPASEPGRLRPAVVRTSVVRAVLALALAAAFVLAFVVARGSDVRHAPIVPSGTTGVLVLDLSASVYEGAMEETIRRMSEAGESAGLVVFSDAAYELLPPGTPSRELVPILRFLKPPPGAPNTLPANPWEELRAGTQIAVGVRAAADALRRTRADRGSIVLISDLEIVSHEVERLAAAIAELRRDGIAIRIVPLNPTPEKRAQIEALTGPGALLREPGRAGAVRAPEERSLAAAAPWTFVLVGALLLALLAANERLLARVEVHR